MTTHPTPTHPGPSGPPAPAPPPRVDDTAGPLPRLGEVIRDAERLGAQMLAVLGRPVDPASAPDVEVWTGLSAAEFQLAVAMSAVRTALAALGDLAELPVPPVGSAIKIPARQDPNPAPGPRIATTDGPGTTTRLVPGEEPTPGSAAAPARAARESAGAVVAASAGASSGPSPRHTHTGPYGTGGRRGAGPTYLGAT